MDIPADALGFAVVVATLLGTAFAVKLLVWGKGPIRRIRGGPDEADSNAQVAELEDHIRELSALVREQSEQLEDYHERLDFAERMLTRQRSDDPRGLEPPN